MIKEQLSLFRRLSSALRVMNSVKEHCSSVPNGKVTGVTKSCAYKISLDNRDESSI